jgi:hypothetical protein
MEKPVRIFISPSHFLDLPHGRPHDRAIPHRSQSVDLNSQRANFLSQSIGLRSHVCHGVTMCLVPLLLALSEFLLAPSEFLLPLGDVLEDRVRNGFGA